MILQRADNIYGAEPQISTCYFLHQVIFPEVYHWFILLYDILHTLTSYAIYKNLRIFYCDLYTKNLNISSCA